MAQNQPGADRQQSVFGPHFFSGDVREKQYITSFDVDESDQGWIEGKNTIPPDDSDDVWSQLLDLMSE